MELVVHGLSERPTVAAVGTWDPFTSMHRELLTKVSECAKKCDLGSLVVVVDPNPAYFIHGRWVIYDDISARLELIRNCAIDTTILLRFSADDLDKGADEFFSTILSRVAIRELWLGVHQSLGSGYKGSGEYIDTAAANLGVKIVRLPDVFTKQTAAAARVHIEAGRLRVAAEIVGRPPVWRQPPSGVAFTAWPPGLYTARQIIMPGGELLGTEVSAVMYGHLIGCSKCVWPLESAEWLAFCRGPADS